MKKAVVVAVLALAVLGAAPARSLVDIDEDAHFYGQFRSADVCITLYAWDGAHPYAEVGSVQTEPAMWVDLYVQGPACDGAYNYLWAYSQYGDRAIVAIDPTGSFAVVDGMLANDTEQMSVRMVFRADDELPPLNPTVNPGAQADAYAAFGRSGTATGTFEGAGLSLPDVASSEATTWASHWASIG